MKNLLLILLVLAVTGIFFHDKQQTANLEQARADNERLTQQLQAETSQLNTLTAQTRQSAAVFSTPSSAPAAQQKGSWSSYGLEGSSLDRPAYKDNGTH